jgi:peptidoglycan hydrolase-like protein with peptidoglycan-binding domain
MQILRIGSKGPEVEKWQSFLLGVGIYSGEVDGVFGSITREATQAFQRRHALLEDGVAGNRTLGEAMRLGFAMAEETFDPLDELESPLKPAFAPCTGADRKRLFGAYEFTSKPTESNREAILIAEAWTRENLVTIEIPQLAGVRGAAAMGRATFHRKVVPKVQELFSRWEAAGLLGLILSWDGAFVPRFIRGSRSVLSSHAHGSAFDINANWNALSAVPARLGAKGCLRQLVPTANALGFYWGGHFSRPDGMHFEVAQL